MGQEREIILNNSKMKEVPFDELEVGVTYVDIDNESSKLATKLHLVKKDEDCASFKYVGGHDSYPKDGDGLICFTSAGVSFYLPTTDNRTGK